MSFSYYGEHLRYFFYFQIPITVLLLPTYDFDAVGTIAQLWWFYNKESEACQMCKWKILLGCPFPRNNLGLFWQSVSLWKIPNHSLSLRVIYHPRVHKPSNISSSTIVAFYFCEICFCPLYKMFLLLKIYCLNSRRKICSLPFRFFYFV